MERRGRGIARPQAFCEMALLPASESDIPADVQDSLRRIVEETFSECDTAYYRLDGLTVSLQGGGSRRAPHLNRAGAVSARGRDGPAR